MTKDAKKTVYFVRHGECQANVDGVIAGGDNDSPLTDNGREQARDTASLLKDIHFDLLVSSPMSRAKDTATIIANTLGSDSSSIILKDEFTERNVGKFAGRPKEEYFAFERSGGEAGELTQDMQERVRRGIAWLGEQDFETALVVSHNGTIRMIRTVIENLPAKDFANVAQLENGSYYKIVL